MTNKSEKKMLSKPNIVLIGFLIVIGYFLFTEHRAHAIASLPYLFLLACPFMHIFMHGGHNGPSSHGIHKHGDDAHQETQTGDRKDQQKGMHHE
jgi:hypothetical protein